MVLVARNARQENDATMVDVFVHQSLLIATVSAWTYSLTQDTAEVVDCLVPKVNVAVVLFAERTVLLSLQQSVLVVVPTYKKMKTIVGLVDIDVTEANVVFKVSANARPENPIAMVYALIPKATQCIVELATPSVLPEKFALKEPVLRNAPNKLH